ncbi:PREDICTED: 60S ribosomal export protein NMD3-like [Tarenaya hassleriana]|uniref:60S ribosomal export protein NMD3-like n=1 Tax=Tarenaya hassleriana TaxID=28532 RepID=UPI00053C129B|nr:PREDICTED: 60S ribosomal export protein NMD3-like [Tarenaya hassleriana]
MNQQSGMFTVHQTVGSVLCCKCGVPMAPNAANMCVTCLRSEVDITEGLQKQVLIIHCPECDCYLQPPKTWLKAQWESKELLTFCVKRLKNLNKVRLVHAEFVWTEPHSKRIKVKLRVQKEVLNGAVLEQAYVVEYTIRDQMCDPCSRIQANPDQWIASVQLRQHVPHRRTFFYLEQLILKHDAASRAIRIQQVDQGIDFFFGNRSHAVNFVDFLRKLVPVDYRHDKSLVSHDSKSNNYNYKYTFSVEICPICREDLVCLPQKVASSLGNLGPTVLCTKVSDSITLLDPITLRHAFLDAKQYWRYRFRSAFTSRQLMKYFVFDVEPPVGEVTAGGTKYALSYAQVARESDIGKIFYILTHLGHILKPGDQALGYDLYAANVNDNELEKHGMTGSLPEVILIKKSYEEQRERKKNKPRSWKLKSLPMETSDPRGRGDEEKMSKEYEEFLRDLEENPELRFNVSLYRDKDYQPSETASMTDGEGAPSVPIEELLVDLKLSDEEEEEEDEDEEDMEE